MTRPTSRLRAPLAASIATLFLVACAAPAEKGVAPPIRTLTRQKAPTAAQLPIIRSEPVAPDPEKALKNYQELLKLDPDADTRAEALRRQADLQIQVQDSQGNSDPAIIGKSIATYQQLLASRPGSPDNDRVLYQLARGYQNIGQTDQAIATLRKLAADYPTSNLIGDARFRTAELLYNLGRYAEAEIDYQFVLGLGSNASFYESAQYKYGWSLFKQTKYDEGLPVFFAILDRELPPGELEDPDAALAAVPKEKADLASSSLRVSSLSFAALGGGAAINRYFTSTGGDPRFYPLIYNALGDLFAEKRRFSDAAVSYAAFIERYPQHASAPKFQRQVIEAYDQGGFNDLVVREKERYVTAYEPSAAYWTASGRAPTEDVVKELRRSMEDLGRHYQAQGQAGKPPANAADFLAAAGWYRKLLDNFPSDPKIADVNLLYADTLYDGGKTADAAGEYLKTAYGYGDHGKASEAAYAAVQAFQRLATEVPAADRNAALRRSIDASLKLADTFDRHPQWNLVVTRAAQDLYTIKALDEAVTVAERLIARQPEATADQRRLAFGVIADSRFAQTRYPEAEAAYARLLPLMVPNSKERTLVVEQLAASIYKQGEAAREAGDLRAAAEAFTRVGTAVPDATIRPNADFDAANAWLTLEDWPKATTALEGFRSRYPANPLVADVDKQLAAAYQKDNKPAQAAGALQRIATRSSESGDTRREAAWLAATLYDDAGQQAPAAKAYEFYIVNFGQPIDRAIEARRKLAAFALAGRDRGRHLYWLRDIVKADEAAGAGRTDSSRLAGAEAALEIARSAAADARAIRLSLPVEKSLPARKTATERAVEALNKAASYGFAATTTAATYELGVVYRDFSRALLDSERPRGLKPDELEQYDLLLEEQADPFDQKAIAAHEANLKRVTQYLWNDSIAASTRALADLSPAKYGKRELREDTYDSLR